MRGISRWFLPIECVNNQVSECAVLIGTVLLIALISLHATPSLTGFQLTPATVHAALPHLLKRQLKHRLRRWLKRRFSARQPLLHFEESSWPLILLPKTLFCRVPAHARGTMRLLPTPNTPLFVPALQCIVLLRAVAPKCPALTRTSRLSVIRYLRMNAAIALLSQKLPKALYYGQRFARVLHSIFAVPFAPDMPIENELLLSRVRCHLSDSDTLMLTILANRFLLNVCDGQW